MPSGVVSAGTGNWTGGQRSTLFILNQQTSTITGAATGLLRKMLYHLSSPSTAKAELPMTK